MTIQVQIIELHAKLSKIRGDEPVVREAREILRKAAYLANLNEQAAQRQLDIFHQKIAV